MSRQLVSRSPDLKRLEDEGYDLSIRENHLLVKVPYANAQREVTLGILASELTLSGDITAPPNTHVVYFIGATVGDIPCDNHGQELQVLINERRSFDLGEGLVASCSFSHKPNPTYPDYYDKMSTYSDMIVGYAQAIDANATAKTFPPIPMDEEESVFRYLDTATSRARIGVELREAPRKVDYLQVKYDAMHRHVVAHAEHVDHTNIAELRDADFVFLSMDTGPAKKFIIQKLLEFEVSFIDVGMGIDQRGSSLGGLVRTTIGTPDIMSQLSFADEDDDEYEQNIQIADLNMLNAALAVIRWKKLFGFYSDLEHEASSIYTIDGNHLLNEGQVE
jgi:hypothetical protein